MKKIISKLVIIVVSFLCFYSIISLNAHSRFLDVTWVKYEKEEDIKETYKGLILTDTFIVYSITIYKDILTNEEYNQTYKLYYDKYYESSYT